MSLDLMSLAWKLPLPHADKLVLLALCDNANDQGLCWPSVKTLTIKCGMDERTIQRIVGRLSEAGHVTVTVRAGRSNYYTVHPTPGAAPPRQDATPAESRSGIEPGDPRRSATPPPAESHPTPGAAPPRILREPSGEPSGEPSVNRVPAARRRRSPETATRLPDDFELTEPRRQVALAERIDPDREFANFRDHFHAASGQRARKHDWDAAWRVWCRRATDMQLPKSRGTPAVSDESKLRRLMDNRAKCAWLAGFRDPRPGETAEQYLQAQNAEHRRWEHEQGRDKPRFSELPAASGLAASLAELAKAKRVPS